MVNITKIFNLVYIISLYLLVALVFFPIPNVLVLSFVILYDGLQYCPMIPFVHGSV